MRPAKLLTCLALLLSTACAPSPSGSPAVAPEAVAETSAPPPTVGSEAVAETTAPAPATDASPAEPGGVIEVAMTLLPGLSPVARGPQTLRRNLSPTPPEGLALKGLPEGDWHHGQAPLTKTVAVPYAIAADRSEIWFDGNRDGVLTADEHRKGGRYQGRTLWFDSLPAETERDTDGTTHRELVFMAVGAQPGLMSAFSRLDGHRAGVLRAAGQDVSIAVVDNTQRGWYGHASRDHLFVDVDGNGRFDTSDESHERYRLGEPIPVGDLDLVVQDSGLFGERLVFGPAPKPARRMAPLAVGFAAPEITGLALDGSEVALSAHRGSWVLVDFWATWCGPCLRELPHLRKLKEAHPELVVLGISGDRQREALESFLERSPLPWPQIYDENAPIRRTYRVRSLPTSYLVAPDGTIAAKSLRGAGVEKRFRREVERWEREQAATQGG